MDEGSEPTVGSGTRRGEASRPIATGDATPETDRDPTPRKPTGTRSETVMTKTLRGCDMDEDASNSRVRDVARDRDAAGRPRNARPRDALGRPLPHDAKGVERVPDDYAPSARGGRRAADGYLADERPFHAHEVLEARWKCGPAEERDLWQGLAQICVGLTHLQRGNTAGAAALLTRGADRVAAYGSRRAVRDGPGRDRRVARALAGSGATRRPPSPRYAAP